MTKKELEEKMDIIVKALEYYANKDSWVDGIDDTSEGMFLLENSLFEENGFERAEQALVDAKVLRDGFRNLEKKLEITVKALEHIKKLPVKVCCDNTAEEALKEIKEWHI